MRTKDILLELITPISEANISSIVFCQDDFFEMLNHITPNLLEFLENSFFLNMLRKGEEA